MKNRKLLLLLLLTAVCILFSACGSSDPYKDLSELFSLSLPQPISCEINGEAGDLSEIPIGKSFEVVLHYSPEDIALISTSDKWSFLSNPELGELSSLLLSFYHYDYHASTPKQKLDALNGYLGETLSVGDRWFLKKQILVPEDKLILLLEEETCQIHTYYLAP